MKLNPDKLQAIILTRTMPIRKIKYLMIERKSLEWTNKVKYLEITIDEKLRYHKKRP